MALISNPKLQRKLTQHSYNGLLGKVAMAREAATSIAAHPWTSDEAVKLASRLWIVAEDLDRELRNNKQEPSHD